MTIFKYSLIALALIVIGLGSYYYYDLKKSEYDLTIRQSELRDSIAIIETEKAVLKTNLEWAFKQLGDYENLLAQIQPKYTTIIKEYRESTPEQKKVIVSKAQEQMIEEMRGTHY